MGLLQNATLLRDREKNFLFFSLDNSRVEGDHSQSILYGVAKKQSVIWKLSN
jgi:hypothetical protein